MSAQDINSIKTFSNHALRPYHAFQEPFAGAWGPRGWCWGLLLVTPWGLLALSLRLWELWRAGKWSSWDGKAHTWVISPAKPGRRLWAGRGLQCPCSHLAQVRNAQVQQILTSCYFNTKVDTFSHKTSWLSLCMLSSSAPLAPEGSLRNTVPHSHTQKKKHLLLEKHLL